MRAQVEEALNKIERAVMAEIETSNIRPVSMEAFKQLLVAGNVLLYFPPSGGARLFKLDSYVVKRDPMGNTLEIITKEMVSPLELPEKYQKMVAKKGTTNPLEDNVTLMTRATLNGKHWSVQQEVDGTMVSDEPKAWPKDKPAFLALRLIALSGEDYGRSYVEEYIGDLKSLEGLSKAVLQASAAAAKVVFFHNSLGSSDAKKVARAESGDVLTGKASDWSVLQMEKYNDFRVALDQIGRLERTVSSAFLLNSAVQRDAERVTAEEIRYLAAELETSLGGIYSTLALEYQLPLVQRLMFRMENIGRLPPLPAGAIKPAMATGIDAVGRGHDMTKLDAFVQGAAVMGEQAFAYLNIPDLMKRRGTSLGIDMDGLVKSPEQVAQEQQAAQQAAMMQQLGPELVRQGGSLVREKQK